MNNKRQNRLLEIADALPEDQQAVLLEFAEFLHSRYGVVPETAEPLSIPRPAEENVINAIKRLTATYPMLDKDKLLNETSALMMQHLLQGQDASKVIDELEVLFRRHYELLTK